MTGFEWKKPFSAHFSKMEYFGGFVPKIVNFLHDGLVFDTDFAEKAFLSPQRPFSRLFRPRNLDFLRSHPCHHLPHICANWPKVIQDLRFTSEEELRLQEIFSAFRPKPKHNMALECCICERVTSCTSVYRRSFCSACKSTYYRFYNELFLYRHG